MGRSYWFECSRCGYRAKVAGRADRGVDFYVQTVSCSDCKALYDAVTRLRVPLPDTLRQTGLKRDQLFQMNLAPRVPPDFAGALNRLTVQGARRSRWVQYPPRCPVSAAHKVAVWEEKDKCPRCGYRMEKNPLPYKIWD